MKDLFGLRDGTIVLFEEFIRGIHWPSWLRGASVTIFVWGLAQGKTDVVIIGLLLYALGHWLVRYFPYKWVYRR